MKLTSEWPDGTVCGAVFSEDQKHRYLLYRILPGAQTTFVGPRPRFPLFLMLNPSTATHEVSDPTVTRCARFTRSWGYDSFHVANLFSLRSTDPSALYEDERAEGDPRNLGAILRSAREAEIVVCAWGVHGGLRNRGAYVVDVLIASGDGAKLRCLGVTKDRHPKHPLYLPAVTPVVPFPLKEVTRA